MDAGHRLEPRHQSKANRTPTSSRGSAAARMRPASSFDESPTMLHEPSRFVGEAAAAAGAAAPVTGSPHSGQRPALARKSYPQFPQNPGGRRKTHPLRTARKNAGIAAVTTNSNQYGATISTAQFEPSNAHPIPAHENPAQCLVANPGSAHAWVST